jgi:hypothetical protein
MTEEEYKKHRALLQSINPMTANCPPGDELYALRERFIEERTSELLEGLYSSPERIQEYILETPYENTKLLTVCSLLGKAIAQPNALKNSITLSYFKDFFEEAVTQEAIKYEEDL